MTKLNHGGPAFPVVWQDVPYGGMTLRDWFAGQALAGIMAFPGTILGNPSKNPDDTARVAYGYADAMLAARKSADAD